MIQTVLGVFLILLHIVCCVLVWLGIKTHLLKVKKYLMALVIFVPFWGTVCVLLLHLQMLTRRDNRIEPGVEKLRVNEEIYKNIFQAVSDTDKKIVPLEEALLINEPGVRRELIMDVLNDDPEEYMDLLKQARMNEDVEVVHYAITAMVELSKEYDFRLQKMEKLYAASPDDPEILEQYCDFMEEYLNQGILEAQMEREQRERYIRLLRQKAEGENDAFHMCASVPKSDENRRLCSGGRDSRADGSEMASERGVLDFEDPVSGRTKKGSGVAAVFKTDERGADLSVV